MPMYGRTKAFGVASPDKHWIVAQQPPLTKKDEATIDETFRNRARTLFSVDDIVAESVALLGLTPTLTLTLTLTLTITLTLTLTLTLLVPGM